MSASVKASTNYSTNFDTKLAAELWLNLGGKDYRLVGKTIRIGRSADNDIVVDHRSNSRYHALITLTSDRVVIEDLKSRNGIKVNGEKTSRAELKDGDRVEIGDLRGVFFQRVKKVPANNVKRFQKEISGMYNEFSKHPSVVSSIGYINRFQNLPRSAMALGGMILLAAGLYMFKGSAPIAPAISENELQAAQIVEVPLDKRQLDKCTEFEDLGNFRQANTCLTALPFTAEVQKAVNRVQERQAELVQKRYKEGQQAFENYYFDIAILKWEEVVLVAGDNSEFLSKARSGIEEAEKRQRLR